MRHEDLESRYKTYVTLHMCYLYVLFYYVCIPLRAPQRGTGPSGDSWMQRSELGIGISKAKIISFFDENQGTEDAKEAPRLTSYRL